MEILRYVIMIALGYLMGSIPVGYLVVKLAKGMDVRQHGSGRSGGTTFGVLLARGQPSSPRRATFSRA